MMKWHNFVSRWVIHRLQTVAHAVWWVNGRMHACRWQGHSREWAKMERAATTKVPSCSFTDFEFLGIFVSVCAAFLWFFPRKNHESSWQRACAKYAKRWQNMPCVRVCVFLYISYYMTWHYIALRAKTYIHAYSHHVYTYIPTHSQARTYMHKMCMHTYIQIHTTQKCI